LAGCPSARDSTRERWGKREDVFIRYSAIQSDEYRSLEEGQQVEFSVEQGSKGLQGADVVAL
jgi:CspA family cold shock protein